MVKEIKETQERIEVYNEAINDTISLFSRFEYDFSIKKEDLLIILRKLKKNNIRDLPKKE